MSTHGPAAKNIIDSELKAMSGGYDWGCNGMVRETLYIYMHITLLYTYHLYIYIVIPFVAPVSMAPTYKRSLYQDKARDRTGQDRTQHAVAAES